MPSCNQNPAGTDRHASAGLRDVFAAVIQHYRSDNGKGVLSPKNAKIDQAKAG